MSIELDGRSKKVLLNIKGLSKAVPREIRQALFDTGKQLRKTASKNILKKPKGGITYTSKDKLGRRRRHVASAPGESWANQSGEARRGIIFKVNGSERLIFGNTVKHAKFLEFGTKNIKPRPAHLISIKQNSKNITTYIENRINKAFKGK